MRSRRREPRRRPRPDPRPDPGRGADPLTDAEHARLAQRRSRANALLADGPAGAARVAHAPAAYVLAHTSSDLARHCELLDPVPAPGEVRIVATPTGTRGQWNLDIATRDRPGLLAAFAGVLAASAIDVRQAVLASWPDGAALQAFTVVAPSFPDLGVLERRLHMSLARPQPYVPVPDARVTFDSATSPLYTSCEVVAPDRPGLLHALATTFAAADVDIHAASLVTTDGIARDRFDLSDPDGRKLDEDAERRLTARLRGGIDRRSASTRA